MWNPKIWRTIKRKLPFLGVWSEREKETRLENGMSQSCDLSLLYKWEKWHSLTKEAAVDDCLNCVSETHHYHLLGSPGLSPVPGVWAGAVRGAGGAPGGQPAAPVPAGHRQRPARGERRGEAEHALAALLLCHQCFHTHHQGALILDEQLGGQLLHGPRCSGNMQKCWHVFLGVRSRSTALSSLCSSPQSLTPTTSGTLSAIPQLEMRGSTAPWRGQRTAPRQADPATRST